MGREPGRSCRVAVVGGGPGGVVCCRFLLEAGHRPVVFESGSEVGGIWAPDPTNDVVYPDLVTNIPTVCMQSFDLDFPKELPSFIRAGDLGRYHVAYAERFGVRKLVRFGARVCRVQPLRSEEEDSRGDSLWQVAWDTETGHCSEHFDAVVVATGHYSRPYRPEVPGQAQWLAAAPSAGARAVEHSRTYRGPSRYASRVLLVVGGRSSAVDIAREARGVAAWVYVLSKGCDEVEAVGNCTHVPLGTAIGRDGRLVLSGGEVIPGPPVERVVLATGYEYEYPFLDGTELGLDFGRASRYVAPLFMHVLHARRPSLGFIGVPLSVPVPIPLFEAQARLVAAHLRSPGTTAEEREAWVAARRAAVGERTMDLHFLAGDAWSHTRDLVRLSGLAGDGLEAYCRRLSLVEEVYRDRVARRPAQPWGEDTYRRVEYSVDWEAGTWSVSEAPGAAAAAGGG